MKKFLIGCLIIFGAVNVMAMGGTVMEMVTGGHKPANWDQATIYLPVALIIPVACGIRLYSAARADTFRGQRLVKVITGIVGWITIFGAWLYLIGDKDRPWVMWCVGAVFMAIVVIRTVAQTRFIRESSGGSVSGRRSAFGVDQFRDIQWSKFERWTVAAFAVVWIVWLVGNAREAALDGADAGEQFAAGVILLPFVACYLWAHPSARIASLVACVPVALLGLGSIQGFWALFLLIMFVREAWIMPTDRRTNFRVAYSNFLSSDQPW